MVEQGMDEGVYLHVCLKKGLQIGRDQGNEWNDPFGHDKLLSKVAAQGFNPDPEVWCS